MGQAVTHLRTVLALDSDNLQAFSTLAFIYYDMNMLETQTPPLQVSARQKPENVERDRFNLQVVECIQGIFRNRRRCPDQTTCGPDRCRARSDSPAQRCVHDLSRFCCRQRELRLQSPENPRRAFLAQLENEAREAFLRLPYFDHIHRYLPALGLGLQA